MKVVNLVLNNFLNDSRVLKTSRSLAMLGYHVEVVALHEAGLPVHQEIDDVTVHRIPLNTRSWPKYKLVQIFKLIEFIVRFTLNYRNVDVLHCNDMGGLIVGCFCKMTRPSIRIVYDSHEYAINDVPNQSVSSIRVKYWLERFFIRYADQVITVSDSIANEYARLYAISKPWLVLNCPVFKKQYPQNLFREKLGIRADQTIFLYQGGLAKGRGIEMIVEAFSGLESDQNVLVCMGYGPLEKMIYRKAKGSNTIFFHPAVTPDVLLGYTSSADYGILFYEDTCLNHRYCSPNKIFEYLMAGLPVLISNLYEMKRLVQVEGVGICTEDNTIEDFRKAVSNSLAQDYAAIQTNVFEARKKYCWEEQEKVLKEIYDAL